MMSKILGVGCFLFAAARGEVIDMEAMVQVHAAVQSGTLLESQVATLKMLSEGMAAAGSHPKKNKLAELFSGGSKPPAAAASLQSVQTGCEMGDFNRLSDHIKSLVDEFKPKFERAAKESDTESIKEYMEDLVPGSCSQQKMLKGMTVEWGQLEKCLVELTNISISCVSCPVHFMQRVVGKNAMDLPFSCAMKCAPAAESSMKCAEVTEEGCDDGVLNKLAPCMSCLNPKLLELTKCTGSDKTGALAGKLDAILSAVQANADAVDELVNKEAADGKEELQALSKSGSVVMKVMGLTFSAVNE